MRIEYNMFFIGRLPRLPWETRRRVETILKRWDNTHIRVSGEEPVPFHKFTTLVRSQVKKLRESGYANVTF